MYGVRGRVAVVTGSGRGIGRAVAIRLAEEGARVVVNAKKGVEEVRETLKRVMELSEGHSVMADVSTREGCKRLMEETLARYGRVDILVNNAGVGIYMDFTKHDDGLIRKIIETSLLSFIYCSQEFAKHVEEGVIINISSLAGILPYYGLSIYSVAKAGVIALTKSLALELAPRVRVNAIAPGLVRTRMGESLLMVHGIGWEEWCSKYTLTNKPIEPEEVAELALALIKIPSITGEVVVIDAGQSLLAGLVGR